MIGILAREEGQLMHETEDAKSSRANGGAYDAASIEKICDATWEQVYRFVYYKVCNREEAEDITQETYMRALPRFRDSRIRIDDYGGYLKTVAVNVLRDWWRRDRRRGIHIHIEDVNPARTAVDDSTESSLQREVIRDALSRLNENYRRVVELRILNGYSVAETAGIMRETEGNIRVLQYRALQTLAKILKVTD